MAGFSFEHLYSEQVVFAVRTGHPLLGAGKSFFAELGRYTLLMPTRGSIIRPVVENFLIANGVASLPSQIETVSDAFGRAFVRDSDAIWIIQRRGCAGFCRRRACRLAGRYERDEGSRWIDGAYRFRPLAAAVDPHADDP